MYSWLVPEGDKKLLGRERKTWKGIRVTVAPDNQETDNKDFGGVWRLAGNSEDSSDRNNGAANSCPIDYRGFRSKKGKGGPSFSPSYSCSRQRLRTPCHKRCHLPVDPLVMLRGGTRTGIRTLSSTTPLTAWGA